MLELYIVLDQLHCVFWLHGYINIDINTLLSPDVIDDITQLEQFNINTISVIYICHTLEHLTRFQYSSALKRWYQLLKKGGVLRTCRS